MGFNYLILPRNNTYCFAVKSSMQSLKAIRGSKLGNSQNKRAVKDVKEDDCGCTSQG